MKPTIKQLQIAIAHLEGAARAIRRPPKMSIKPTPKARLDGMIEAHSIEVVAKFLKCLVRQ